MGPWMISSTWSTGTVDRRCTYRDHSWGHPSGVCVVSSTGRVRRAPHIYPDISAMDSSLSSPSQLAFSDEWYCPRSCGSEDVGSTPGLSHFHRRVLTSRARAARPTTRPLARSRQAPSRSRASAACSATRPLARSQQAPLSSSRARAARPTTRPLTRSRQAPASLGASAACSATRPLTRSRPAAAGALSVSATKLKITGRPLGGAAAGALSACVTKLKGTHHAPLNQRRGADALSAGANALKGTRCSLGDAAANARSAGGAQALGRHRHQLCSPCQVDRAARGGTDYGGGSSLIVK